MKQAKPIRHGEHAGYARGCKCDACMEAHRVYNRERMRIHRRYKQGIGPKPISRWISPDVTQRHLLWLKTKGLSINAIALQTGLNEQTLKKIRSGKSKYVERETEAKVLRVRANDYGPKQLVKNFYVKQIIKAIQDAGYTTKEIRVMLGLSAHGCSLIHPGEWVRIETQERWERLYLQLFCHPAPFRKPQVTKHRYDQRNASRKVRKKK